MNSTSDIVTVVGGPVPSGGRDAEAIELVFTPSGTAALAPVTIGASVASAVFSASANQSYGFDDMDSAAGTRPHVSVKKNDTTNVHIDLDRRNHGRRRAVHQR